MGGKAFDYDNVGAYLLEAFIGEWGASALLGESPH